MRTWRKLESGIITSERLAKVSDSAKWLFTLLIVAQDDEGKYPWTSTMIRSLTVTTDWDSHASDSLLSELTESGVAELRDGMVLLRNGAEKNGTPANSKKYAMIYPSGVEPYGESLTSRERVVDDSIDKSRVKKIREELELEKTTEEIVDDDLNFLSEFGKYYSDNIKEIAMLQADEIKQLDDEYHFPVDWAKEVVLVAVGANVAKPWPYCMKVLENWATGGDSVGKNGGYQQYMGKDADDPKEYLRRYGGINPEARARQE